MALVDLSEIKIYLNINGNKYDNSLAMYANVASAAIESYCGRSFESAYVIELHDGGRPSIFVNRPPINNVNSVAQYDGTQYVPLIGPSAVTGELPNTVANASAVAQYTWDTDTGEIVRNPTIDSGLFILDYQSPLAFNNYKKGVKIEYNGGYDVIPNDIKMAAIDYVKILHKNEQGTSTISFQGESKENINLAISGFPPHIKRILNFYRISW